MSYQMAVPFKVDKLAPRALEAHMIKAKELLAVGAANLSSMAASAPTVSGAGSGGQSWMNALFGFCATAPHSLDESQVMDTDEIDSLCVEHSRRKVDVTH